VIPFRESIQERARTLQRIVAFPEGDDERTLDAVARLQIAGLVRPLVLGDPDRVRTAIHGFGGDGDAVEVLDHTTDPRFELFSRELHELRASRGWSEADARERMRDPLVFAAALVRRRHVHGSVAGASRTTGDVLRAALWLVGTAPGIRTVSSSFYMVVPSFRDTNAPEVLTFTDASVVPDPDAGQLADIAAAAADARTADRRRRAARGIPFLFHPRQRGRPFRRQGARRARAFRELMPGVTADGELQVDAALIPTIASARRRLRSRGTRQRPRVPDLDAGNIGYKLVQRLATPTPSGRCCRGSPGRATTCRAAPAPTTSWRACVTALQD
jgi:phosphate acetyltransferase